MAAVVADFGAAILCGLCVPLDVAVFVGASPVEPGIQVALDGLLAVLSPAAWQGSILGWLETRFMHTAEWCSNL